MTAYYNMVNSKMIHKQEINYVMNSVDTNCEIMYTKINLIK